MSSTNVLDGVKNPAQLFIFLDPIYMCGINGAIHNSTSKGIPLIEDMNSSLQNRGPDGNGCHYHKDVSMGHTRLAINTHEDIRGHQPMFYNKELGASSKQYNHQNINESSLSITFNGEIYNFEEIKDELISKGYNFSTDSDTELILAAYQEYGKDCVKHFDGMWAFSIYDQKKKYNVLL